jgi:hypothetical protein
MLSQLFRFVLNKTVAKVKNIPVAASYGEIDTKKQLYFTKARCSKISISGLTGSTIFQD